MVNGSGVGVATAAKTKMMRKAGRQVRRMTAAGSTCATLSATRNTGMRKASPKTTMKRVTKLKYSAASG